MNFQKEYEILSSLKSDKILEISYDFKKHRIKIYFSQRQDYEFLILVCENSKHSFVKNYPVFFKNQTAMIGGFWGTYHKYAKGLANSENYGFSEFYNKLKQSIRSVDAPSDEFKIEYLSSNAGIRKIRTETLKSAMPKEAIYFDHVRRTPMSPTQFDKVSDLLGKDVAIHLKSSNVTAVFTPDITRQKSFILVPHTSNG